MTVRTPASIESHFANALKPHQQRAFAKLLSKGGEGFLLADCMGLGKTLVMLYSIVHFALAKQREQNKSCRVLAVVPKSVIDAWLDQVETHFNATHTDELLVVYEYASVKTHERVEQLQKVKRDCRHSHKSLLTLVSYDIATNDAATLYRSQKRKDRWHYVIFDEVHRFKNPESNRTQAARRHLHTDTVRIGLSGTPCNNSASRELASVCYVLFPSLPELHDVKAYEKGSVPVALKRRMMCRTSLRQVGIHLPPPREHVCKLTMDVDSAAAKVYEDKLVHTRRRYVDYLRAPRHDLIQRRRLFTAWQGALQQLLQCTTHPSLSEVRKGEMTYDLAAATGSMKLTETLRLVRTHGTRKMIVTSASVQFLHVVAHAMNQPHVLYTGQLTQEQRRHALRTWRTPDNGVNVLLLSMKAGGEGLTLVEAHTMVIADTCYNPVHAQQVVHRVYRMGLAHTVHIHTLVLRGTVDAVLHNIVHPFKRKAADNLLGGGGQPLPKFTQAKYASLSKELTLAWEEEIVRQKGSEALLLARQRWVKQEDAFLKARVAKQTAIRAAVAVAKGAAKHAQVARKRTKALRRQRAPKRKHDETTGALAAVVQCRKKKHKA